MTPPHFDITYFLLKNMLDLIWGARYFLLTNIKVDQLIFFAKKYVLSVYLGGGRSGFQAQHKKQPEDGKETGGGEGRAAGHGS